MHDKKFISDFNLAMRNALYIKSDIKSNIIEYDQNLQKINNIENTDNQDDSNYLDKVINYIIDRPGKRFRPYFAKLIFDNIDIKYRDKHSNGEYIYDFFQSHYINNVIGLECIHMYSLVIDDMPFMDDDDYRSNLPTLHKAFSVPDAVLAADFLLSSGLLLFDIRMHSFIILMLKDLMKGQMLDIKSHQQSRDIFKMKTASLFRIAGKCVVFDLDPFVIDQVDILAEQFGIFYQYADSYMDGDINNDKILNDVLDDFYSKLNQCTILKNGEKIWTFAQNIMSYCKKDK